MAKFPFFENNPGIVYLDSAATTQKPKIVIDKTCEYYLKYNFSVEGVASGNIFLQELIHQTRKKTLKFLNIPANNSEYECVFTKSATDSLNMLAFGLENYFKNNKNITIVTTKAEHHANLLPWQRMAKNLNGILKYVPVDFKNGIEEDQILKNCENADILTLTHLSNVTGQVLDLERIIKKVRLINPNILLIVDGSQAVSQIKVDLEKLDVDFYVFSSHKMYGPLGLGVLVGKINFLNKLSPMTLGGKMIKTVTLNDFKNADLPYFLEAGTPNGEAILGFNQALKFMDDFNYESQTDNYKYLEKEILKLENIEVINKNATRKGVLSFTVKNIDLFDLNMYLSSKNILIRTGNHCCQPLMKTLNLDSTMRVSLGVYNTKEDIDKFIKILKKGIEIFV